MITIFRKEMKKWHSVLWVVFASMAVSGLSLVFWRSQGGEDAEIASVDGVQITGKDYRRSMQQLQRQFSMISSMYGIPFDVLIKTFLGGQDVQSLALENAIKDTLVSGVVQKLNISIGQDFFTEELVKSLPQGISDGHGRVNMEMYQNYLERLSMSPAEFEHSKELEFKKEAVNRVVGAAGYVPSFSRDYHAAQDGALKSFTIVKFDQAHFKGKTNVDDKELTKFYNERKEHYRVAEKKQARVVRVSPKNYENSVVVDDQSIQAFYDKNKANRYRIAPKIRVRHIFLSGHDEATRKKAEDLLGQVRKDAGSFALLAKKHSQANSAVEGGLTERFGRGTHDDAFEKAAFKLMKKDEVAPLVRTAKGFEIIMLDERVAASEKKLSEVRDEIVTTLRTRKSMNHLKSDLEALLHQARSDAGAFENFTKTKHLKAELTEWLAADEKAKADSLDGKLVERLFGKSSKSVGYFMHDDEYVLYQVLASEKSFIQPLAQVEKQVTEDYVAQKATDDLKHFVKAAKGAILEKKKTLSSYKSEGFSVVEADNLKKTDSVSSLKDVAGLVEKAFVLDDKNQVLEYRHKGAIYLIQLVNSDLGKEGKDAQAASRVRKSADTRADGAVVNGFIASLQRNAKITVNETLMNAYKSL
jgi:hypothetical protein